MPQSKRLRDKNRVKRRKDGGAGKLTSPNAIRKMERDYQVLCLRRDGYTMAEIAATLDICSATAYRSLSDLLKVTLKESAETTEEHRQLQLERLDQLLKAYTPLAVGFTKEVPDPKGLPGAMKTVIVPPNAAYGQMILQIETRRSKLLALDVPETKRLDVSGVREYVGVDLEQV